MSAEYYVASLGRYPVRFIHLTGGRAVYEITSIGLATKFEREDFAAAKARHYGLQAGWSVGLVSDYRPCARCGQERPCTDAVCDECAARSGRGAPCRLCPTLIAAGQMICPACRSTIQHLTYHARPQNPDPCEDSCEDACDDSSAD